MIVDNFINNKGKGYLINVNKNNLLLTKDLNKYKYLPIKMDFDVSSFGFHPVLYTIEDNLFLFSQIGFKIPIDVAICGSTLKEEKLLQSLFEDLDDILSSSNRILASKFEPSY